MKVTAKFFNTVRWRLPPRTIREITATLARSRRDLIHGFLVWAMSMEAAKQLLGFRPGDTPSDTEIKQAWKRAAIKHHPDRGGDPEVMKQLNVAHDVLLGKQRPDRPSPTGPSGDPGPTYSPPPLREDVVTWQEAEAKARIPPGVEWRFLTDRAYGGYGDKQTTGYVVYGATKTEHVFVAVHRYVKDPNMFDNLKVDKYEMRVKTIPKDRGIADVAPRVIREIWPGDKAYNAKVYILPKGTRFDDKLNYSTNLGRKVSFKDAMGLMGEATPSTWKGKVDVVLELGRDEKFGEYPVTLVVNGHPYELSDRSNQRIWKVGLLRVIWGPKGYFYAQSKKNITKIKKAKKVLGWLAQNLHGEPQALIDALTAAADKAK